MINKIIILMFLILMVISCVFSTRIKYFAQYYPPRTDPFDQTGFIWNCRKATHINSTDNVPGVYLVFSIRPVVIDGIRYRYPLKYIGRSTSSIRNRISNHLSGRTPIIHRYDIVCYMQFPTDPGFTNTNDVTPVEQQLLQAFAARVNSWDNQGYSPDRDHLYFDINENGYDIMRSLYTSSDIRAPINIYSYVNGLNIDTYPFEPNLEQQNIVTNEETYDIFTEGVPYEGGYILDSSNQFKKHSHDYLNKIYNSHLNIPSISIQELYGNDYNAQDNNKRINLNECCDDLNDEYNQIKKKMIKCEQSIKDIKSKYLNNYRSKTQCDKDYDDVYKSLKICQRDYQKDVVNDKSSCHKLNGFNEILQPLKKCQKDFDSVESSIQKTNEQLKDCNENGVYVWGPFGGV